MARIAVIGSTLVLLALASRAQVTFIIESLPAATPDSDTIFITGTFNNWKPNDPRYVVRWQANGQLAVTVPSQNEKFEYKFTRGSWTKVETNKENKYTENRVYLPGTSEKIFIRIDNWLDLGGAKDWNYILFYYFVCIFQGVALSLIAYRIHKKDDQKFKPLLLINTILIAMLLLLILKELVNQVWQSYFVFIFHIALFCWMPLLLFFICSFQRIPIKKFNLYLIPGLIISLFVITRIFNLLDLSSVSRLLNPPLTVVNALVIAFGLIFNALMAVHMYQRFSFLKRSAQKDGSNKTHLLYYFFWTNVAALVIIPVNLVILFSSAQHPFFTNFEVVAVVMSALFFIEAYFLWRYPDVVKEDRTYTVPVEESLNWVERVNLFMNENKPFKNPDLSISDLAEMLGTKPHVLSKVINDSYHKNFRDFVNTYRIEEFIRLANTKEFKHYTFLALAQEVGFNSKSTFNLAFKKMTNLSPREYFKSKELT